MLTWFYISGFIFLMGGEINAIIEGVAPEGKASGARAPGEAPPPARRTPEPRPGGRREGGQRRGAFEWRRTSGRGATLRRSGRRWPRRLLIVAAVLVTVVVAIRMLIDPIASHYTRKGLNDAEGMSGDFQRVHVTVFPPGYEIWRIKLIEEPGGSERHPLFYAERVGVSVDWRALLRGRLAARARLDEPKITITKRAEAPKEKKAKQAAIPDVDAALRKVIPARVQRVEVRDGEILYRDLTAPRHPQIWLHALEVSAENLATREELAGGRPATVNASAKLGKSGDVTMFVSANPFADKLEFAGETSLKGWKVAELFDLIQPATKLQTPEGTLDVFVEFRAKGGEITGGVKPVLKNVRIRPTEDDFGNKLKAWLADKGLRLFSDRVPDRNAVATVVPIKGKLTDPDIQLWPTILGVIRNAFVEGISSGFTHLPPPRRTRRKACWSRPRRRSTRTKGRPRRSRRRRRGRRRRNDGEAARRAGGDRACGLQPREDHRRGQAGEGSRARSGGEAEEAGTRSDARAGTGEQAGGRAGVDVALRAAGARRRPKDSRQAGGRRLRGRGQVHGRSAAALPAGERSAGHRQPGPRNGEEAGARSERHLPRRGCQRLNTVPNA